MIFASFRKIISIFIIISSLFVFSLYANSSVVSSNSYLSKESELSKAYGIKTKQYKVRKGDNLWVISKKNRPSKKVATMRMLEAIRFINKGVLNNESSLKAGMKLSLPVTAGGVYKILRNTEIQDSKNQSPNVFTKLGESDELSKKDLKKDLNNIDEATKKDLLKNDKIVSAAAKVIEGPQSNFKSNINF